MHGDERPGHPDEDAGIALPPGGPGHGDRARRGVPPGQREERSGPARKSGHADHQRSDQGRGGEMPRRQRGGMEPRDVDLAAAVPAVLAEHVADRLA
jgi:hypothetical protein